MRIPRMTLTLALLMFAATMASAAPPAAPQVTMGADIKLLRFDWNPVPGATFYRLWIKPGGSRYISVGERIPASVTQAEHSIPVHLQDWARTRYVVTACNATGCTSSRALDPRPLMLEAIGYVKASNTDAGDNFGHNVVLSADGYTLAVNSPVEGSNASGVNGNQADNSSTSGAVYVFRRRGNTWRQEAYLKAGVNQPGQFFGSDPHANYRAQAISADGSMLAVGATREDVNGLSDAGAVYVYHRAGSTWSLMATLHSPTPLSKDWFGLSVDMSHDGRTLKVASLQPLDEEGNPEMRTHIFVRPANSWQFSVTLAPFHAGDFCQSVRLSGDGNTLASYCIGYGNNLGPRVVTMKRAGNMWIHVSDLRNIFSAGRQAIALNPDATVMALAEEGVPRVTRVYRWDAANWVREAEFPAPTLNDPIGSNSWGADLALGDDGQLLAIGDPLALDTGAGISTTVMPGTELRGAVYLYRRNENASWALRAVVKSPNPNFGQAFGTSVALSLSGRTLAVGASGEDGGSTGIDGDRNDQSALNAGAAYLY